MSLNGSKKEAIYTLWQKKYPETLESIIGLKLDEIKVEVANGKKKTDLLAVNRAKRIEIMVENQLKTSDSEHLLNKIVPLIESRSEAVIVWTAPKFQPEHIQYVKTLLRNNSRKYINFYFVQIREEMLQVIQKLNNMYELDVWYHLNLLNEIEDGLYVVDKFEQMPLTHIGKVLSLKNVYDFSRVDDRKEFLSEELARRIPYFLNFHNSKKHHANDMHLKIGAGRTDITFFASVLNYRNRATVELRFGNSKANWYEAFKQHEELMKQEIDPTLYFSDKDRKIAVGFRSKNEPIESVVERVVGTFERFILYVSPYIYGNKNLNELP